jgi:hypothetical protein
VEELKLDVSKPEYSGRISSDEIWQTVAFNKAVENIALLISQSKALFSGEKQDEVKDINRIHDAIFISGSRGTGKSVFLCNLEQQWDKSKREGSVEGRAKFLRVIDPTLLIGAESFVNVVIAHIHQFVHSKIIDTSQYHHILGELADSLAQTEYKSREDLGGLDRIISYQSSMDLEANFHKYLDFCCKQLSCDVFVLPIDDVDMALEQSHDVLETIRRLLSCPHLIPIVSGDKGLYEQVLLNEFSYCKKNSNRRLFPEGSHYPKHLMKQYWRKIFPANLTIPLVTIDRLFDDVTIVNSSKLNLKSKDFFTKINKLTSPLVNHRDSVVVIGQPNTARKLVQYAKSFYQFLEVNSEIEPSDLWQELSRYSLSTANGQGYLIADAEIHLLKRDEQRVLRLADLPLFNVIEQNTISLTNSTLKKYKYYDDNLVKSVKLDRFSNTERDISQVVNAQQNIIINLKDKIEHSLATLPKIEIYTYGSQFSSSDRKRYIGSTTNTDRTKFLIELFSHHDYYAGSSYTTYQIYFGKAFELFSLTLLQSVNEGNCFKIIERVCTNKPFHSLLAIAPTKSFTVESNETIDDTVDDYLHDNNSYISFLASEISLWEKKNSNLLEEVRKQGLTYLISRVFNKVFTQFFNMRQQNVFGFNKTENKKDSLFHIAQRFRIVLLSAIGGFLKQGNVALQNTATTQERETLLGSLQDYSDRAFQLNVHGLITDDKEEYVALMRVIYSHPLFGIIEDSITDFNKSNKANYSDDSNTKNEIKPIADDVFIEAVTTSEAILSDVPSLLSIFDQCIRNDGLYDLFSEYSAGDILGMLPLNLESKGNIHLIIILQAILIEVQGNIDNLTGGEKRRYSAYMRALRTLQRA